ncbi:MAG TPA: glycosyltransferase family 2 protein [Opitutaceae bacterium]
MVRPATTQPELSVVIPFYNEEANVAKVLAELRDTLTKLDLHVEVLAINDGSRDRTAAEIDAAALAWPAVRPIHFGRNSGQAAALYHGFHEARGAYLAMLDGDGQNPPSELARLWE